MLRLRSCLHVAAMLAVAAFTACKSKSPFAADAPGTYNYDLSCAGNQLPTSAPSHITLAGAVAEVYLDNGVATLQRTAGATIAECVTVLPSQCSETINFGSTSSGSDGTWVVGVDLPGMPSLGWLFVSKPGIRPTYLWPNAPLYSDILGVSVPVLREEFVSDVGTLGLPQDPDKALVIVLVDDCKGQPIIDGNNVHVSLITGGTGSGSGKPVGDTTIDSHPFADVFAGVFVVMNVPPGPIVVNATYKGVTFRSHTILTYAGTTVETEMIPGIRLGP